MSNHKRGPAARTVAVITQLGVVVVGGLAAYVKFTPADKVTPQEAPHVLRKGPDVDITEHPIESSRGKVLVFTPRYEGETLKLDSVETPVPAGEDPRVFAVNAFLQASKIVERTARLLSVDVKDGEATLSFNEAFAGGYGTDDEHTLIDGLRASLGQFEEIQKLRLTIEGKPIESLGSVELTDGLDVTRPSKSESASPPQPSR